MSTFRGIIVSSAALLLTGMGLAQAADLPGGYGGRGSIKDDYAPAHQPRGCGTWYARIDGGYSSFDKPYLSQVGIDDYLKPKIDGAGMLGGGFGRYFTCNLRGDITVDHRFQSNVHGFNANPFSPIYGQVKWGYESTAVMANLYYDFDLRSRFTPYVGIGLGGVHNQFKRGGGVVGAAGPAPGNATVVEANDSWSTAAALMTGFSFALRDRLAFDAGYRFLYMGQAKTGQTYDAVNTAAIGGRVNVDTLHSHEFRLGLRYDIH